MTTENFSQWRFNWEKLFLATGGAAGGKKIPGLLDLTEISSIAIPVSGLKKILFFLLKF